MCDEDGDCHWNWKIGVGIAIFAVGALLVAILVPLSLHKLSFDEVAIEYNTVSRALGTEVLGEGLHDTGPSGSLLVFKTTQREGKMSRLRALSADSIELYLDVSVFYSIIRNDVRNVVDKFGNQAQHDQFVIFFSETVVRDTAATFTAKQFYLQRQSFQTQLQAALVLKFASASADARVDSVQVIDITLPKPVLAAMEASTLAEQDIQNAQSERGTQLQAANIKLTLAQSEATLVLTKVAKDVAIIQQNALQAVIVEREKMTARSNAFTNISAGLGLGGEFFVDSYLKYLVAQSNQGKTVIGV
jgi:regulator of protease activity HflC (stomatin/prohibitin superfamily)